MYDAAAVLLMQRESRKRVTERALGFEVTREAEVAGAERTLGLDWTVTPVVAAALRIVVARCHGAPPAHSSQLTSKHQFTSTAFAPTNTAQSVQPRRAIMADLPPASPGPAAAETPAQEKARLRRERLAAKSGASRLQQISALQGGPPKDLSEIQKDLPGVYGLDCQPMPVAARTLRACTPSVACTTLIVWYTADCVSSTTFPSPSVASVVWNSNARSR
jgi:hypothetical protein